MSENNYSVAIAYLILALGLTAPAKSQNTGLAQRVLVVYNTNIVDSVSVATYYAARRGIPNANLCGVGFGATTYVGASEFDTTVKAPIKACLNAVGPTNILYIVFSFQTPYGRVGTDGNGYTVDQSIADIWDQYTPMIYYPYPDNPHPYYAGSQTQGNVYQSFVSFASYRGQAGSALLYSVWRLDAATAAIAQGLVDKAIQAETGGLTGAVCIDRNRGDLAGQYDGGYLAGDWNLHNAALFATQARFAVTEDPNDAEFGTAPAPLRCDNAALYSGWYSLDHYNDAFTWNPGAIGWHLDSASALDPRGGTNWSANALIKGITVTSGSVKEPYLESLPAPDGVFRNLFEGANVGDAFLRNTPYLKWMILYFGDPLYRPFPAGFPAFRPGTNPQTSLPLGPQYLVGGQVSLGTVTLANPAPPGGNIVSLASDTPAAASVPSTVTVPPGALTAVFPIATKSATSDTYVQVSATSNLISRVNTLGVLPLLSLVNLTPGTVTGPATTGGAVYLNDYAPAGGTIVTLTSDQPALAAVPPVVIVPAGMISASFNIAVGKVSTAISPVITAAALGASRMATLTLNPGSPTSTGPTLMGLSDTAFITRLYQSILGRSPDAAGLSYWQAKLNGGETRGAVADEFLRSPEYASIGLFIVSNYLGVLGREPELAGYQYWFAQMRGQGKQQIDVTNGFLASPEYVTRFGNPDNPTFVTELYANVLGRVPDPAGFQYWTNFLNTGQMSRPQVVQGFIGSPEFQVTTLNQLYVDLAYFALLNRAPTPAELTSGKQAIAAGQSTASFLDGIVASPEFLALP